MLKDKVEQGWQLLLLLEAIHSILNPVLAPLGIIEQDMINEYGKIVPKWQLNTT
jgi:hypothetical protein